MTGEGAVLVEPATLDDLDAIQDIERHSFTSAWTREALEAELARPHARIAVARAPAVIGFISYWIVEASAECHVLSIATHPDRRRAGVGRTLLDHALRAAREAGATLASLEVRRGNRPAIALYERAGFRIVHTRVGYYQADGEDALVMLLDLTLTPASP